jgi:2,4'-dihydroxyacetophenone dioxygenase
MATALEPILRNSRSMMLPDGSSVVRPEELPWTPWALDGTYFKLLSINRRTGMWAATMKIDPNTHTDVHYHFGDAHIFVTSGGYSYEHDRVNAGEYNIECGSVAHEPIIGADGLENFVVFYGGISGVDANGRPAGEFVDVEWMYRAAIANNAGDHLPPPPPPREKFAEN